MRYEMKSVNVWSFIKVAFFVNLVLGFVAGILTAVFFGFIAAMMAYIPGGMDLSELDSGEPTSGIMIIILPFMTAFFAGVFYTLLEVVVVVTYNLVAKMVGGFELTLTPVTSDEPYRLGPMYAQSMPVNPYTPPSASSTPPNPPIVPPATGENL
ncbi:MAG: DUF3566 domain-containing protein [candidate division Zixibacteria bacterium]|nr:DUF3566 domain-containing protein [candidate division Zixibacteria bacterium]